MFAKFLRIEADPTPGKEYYCSIRCLLLGAIIALLLICVYFELLLIRSFLRVFGITMVEEFNARKVQFSPI